MSIAKVIEVLAEGDSIEEAVETAAKDASKSLHNIRHIYVQDIQAFVGDDNEITKYRINAKVTFVVD